MEDVYVNLSTPSIVQKFVKTITKLEGEFELISGKYILDARSLMGIFSMDITKPIHLRVYNGSDENMTALNPYLARNPAQNNLRGATV